MEQEVRLRERPVDEAVESSKTLKRDVTAFNRALQEFYTARDQAAAQLEVLQRRTYDGTVTILGDTAKVAEEERELRDRLRFAPSVLASLYMTKRALDPAYAEACTNLAEAIEKKRVAHEKAVRDSLSGVAVSDAQKGELVNTDATHRGLRQSVSRWRQAAAGGGVERQADHAFTAWFERTYVPRQGGPSIFK